MRTFYTQPRHIVSISTRDKQKHYHFKYVNEEKEVKTYKTWLHRLFFSPTKTLVRETGYTMDDDFLGMRRIWTEEEILNQGFLVEDKVVYYKPYISFKFTEGSEQKHFQNMTELNNFLKPILIKNKDLIKLIED